jgi:hypothetical protein
MLTRSVLIWQLALLVAFVWLLSLIALKPESLTVANASILAGGLGTLAGLLSGHAMSTNRQRKEDVQEAEKPKEAVQ